MTRKLLWLLPLGFVAVLFYLPVAKILSLGLGANWLSVLADPKIQEVVWFTIWQAILSTVITVVAGIPIAYLLYRKEFFGRGFLRALISIPFVLPSIVVAIGFTVFRDVHDFYQDLGFTFLAEPIYWIIAAHVFVNLAIATRTIGGLWAGLDTQVEEAAELDGAGRIKVFLEVTIAQLRPAIFSAAALVFLFSATSFGIILVLGGDGLRSIETAIFFFATSRLDLETASVLVLAQTLITMAAFLVGSSLSKGAVGLELVDEGARKPRIDKRDLPVVLFSAAVIIGLIVMPLILVLVNSFSVSGSFGIENFRNLATQGARDLLNLTVFEAALNSLRNMTIAALLAFTLGTLVSWLLSKSRAKGLDLLFLIPLGVSSVVLGLGYLVFFDENWLFLRSSWLVVPLAQSVIALPLVIRFIFPALVSIGKEAIEQAKLDGASTFQIWRYVESGMIRQVLLTAFGFAALVSLGEFGAASFLAYGSQSTIPTLLYRLISRPGEQNFGMAMAVSAILIVVSFLVVYLISRGNRKESFLGAA